MGKFDNQDEEVDDFDGADEQEADEEGDDEELDAAESSSDAPAPAASSEDSPEERTVSSRQKMRDEMSKEIEEFLARGGKIQHVDPNVTADPPRKPESDYGSRPI